MDRMEIIRIAGYTEDEKVEIARKHLIPNAIAKHGLKPEEWSVDKDALLLLIRRYTRESGVRNLERELSTLIRKAVKELTLEKTKSIAVDTKKLEAYLGVPKYRYGEVEADDMIGVVTGLAWTDVGGELLTIEGVMMPGKGRMTVTGNLRDADEGVDLAAASYVRSRAISFGIEPPTFDKRDIHVHVGGATPKDGPPLCRHGHRDRLDADRYSVRGRRHDRDRAARPHPADRRSKEKPLSRPAAASRPC
jgi:ATP-dependent Lon protease